MARGDWGEGSAARVRAAAGRWTARAAPARPAPKSASAQARFVRDNVYGGSTRRMAEAYGVAPRTVQRWVKGSRKMPRERERLAADVGRVRHRRAERRARLSAARGQAPRVRARGYIGPTGTAPSGRAAARARGTDTKRMRQMPDVELTPGQAADLEAAQEAGDTDAMREILGDAYTGYFEGGHNRWVTGTDIGEIASIEFL